MTDAPELLAVGETMAMVAPLDGAPLDEAREFRMEAGGAESNVAAHVAALGHRAAWFSRLGDDPLGDRILRQLASRGVDVSRVERDAAHPTGLYVKNPGRGVHYYRAGSAAAQLAAADAAAVDLDGVRILHVSGITAAISATASAFLDALVDAAHAAGVTVSFDVNHRAALWPVETASRRLAELAARADLVFVGRDEAETLWGTATADEIRELLPGPAELVVKDGDVGATLFDADGVRFVPALRVEVLEAVGAGDAFAGGYLAARLEGASADERLRTGHVRAALVLQTTDDTIEEIR
ncbi:sugar kinase [Protaetiibacter mangrovi]|uniref:Sugar kinase n=1 Tax=Protaetiibacter mangrovi TaxID=2970926 RepID=A0ABT1ZGU4_9MICO|nr:sugar kinase [Protaetiibacter mangrovi]MCS0499921.1 sugar kinase [Protaetiibacter mangrovi]